MYSSLLELESKTRNAGTAALRDCMRALRLVRYLRSIVVWDVFGRPREALVDGDVFSVPRLGEELGDGVDEAERV